MQEYLNLLDELIRLRPTSENIPAVNRVAETIRKFLPSIFNAITNKSGIMGSF